MYAHFIILQLSYGIGMSAVGFHISLVEAFEFR